LMTTRNTRSILCHRLWLGLGRLRRRQPKARRPERVGEILEMLLRREPALTRELIHCLRACGAEDFVRLFGGY
jgi:hypothetical protein